MKAGTEGVSLIPGVTEFRRMFPSFGRQAGNRKATVAGIPLSSRRMTANACHCVVEREFLLIGCG